MARAYCKATTKSCEVCSKPFLSPVHLHRKFCCRKCYFASERLSGRIPKVCEQCGKMFKVFVSHFKKGMHRFCSKVCYLAHRRAKYPPINKSCQTCGKPFVSRKQKFCSFPCSVTARNIPLESRFQRRIAEPNSNGCMLWLGAVNNRGYGILRGRGTKSYAHRVAYELAYGPIPDGLFVCHRCDVRNCCQPLHLFLGTNADNTADKVNKGRHKKGEQMHSAKITAEQVREIRRRYAAGGVTLQELNDEYGLSSQASAIVSRRTWKHVT